MKVKLHSMFVDHCEYFQGSGLPYVQIDCTYDGYTSRQLREALINAARHGDIMGNDVIFSDYIESEADQKRADDFYQKAFAAFVKRDIKYRGKYGKSDNSDLCIYVIFSIEG